MLRTFVLALLVVLAACAGPPEAVEPAQPAGSEVIEGDVDLPNRLVLSTSGWATDWSRRTIDLDELLVGIQASDPRDRIPPIDEPAFRGVDESTWLEPTAPGVLVEIDGDARFYPLAILTRHEIVNDEVGGAPLAVTYCPLCNTAVVFDRRLDDTTLRLGVSGLLRNSDLVMWDDDTESLWQQVTGEAIVGARAGQQLAFLPSRIVSYERFASAYGSGRVLADDQGFGIRYGTNPYVGYSSRDEPYGFFDGDPDSRLPALERVVGVEVGREHVAYSFAALAEVGVVNDEVGGLPVAVFWGDPDTADALDAASIANSRGIGTGVAYVAEADGRALTFARGSGGTFVDSETGSTWDILGAAVEGPLAGETLDVVLHRNEFFFAWAAFFPDGEVWGP